MTKLLAAVLLVAGMGLSACRHQQPAQPGGGPAAGPTTTGPSAPTAPKGGGSCGASGKA